ncbi:MAG: peptide chain release factor N(5)-glutamine methyltransferase [Oscillospiraceae bacterium]|nr:peptide chain release factor N(5)-glutamine methyltransferase [Oscillospiraceae bacterium]
MKTYNDIYLAARHELKRAGVEAFDLEARLIISAVAGKSKEEFYRDLKLYALGDTEERVQELIERRKNDEPLAYVLGEWEFMGLPMKVDPGVLIPRPDTELLAEKALGILRESSEPGRRVLDMCCGTGCIGISIARMKRDCRVILADNSMKALRIARHNCLKNSVTQNTTVLEADAMKDPPMLLGKFDLIVSNPPYVPSFEVLTLDNSVKDFEPVEALDGGPDGLDFYRAMIPHWTDILKPGGSILFECGEGQAEKIGRMLEKVKFEKVEYYEDPAGTKRVIAGLGKK